MRTETDKYGETPVLEALEPRLLLSGSAIVSEFMASNTDTVLDGDGNSSDWIELHNPTAAPVNLEGWFLTDKTDDLDKWRIPNVTLAAAGDPGGNDYLVIFASGQDDASYPYFDGQHHHTNFTLSKEGENVLLVRPDGLTVEHGYEDYPDQVTDVSYGVHDGDPQFFDAPTPGEANTPGFVDYVKDTKFDIDRGFFDAAFDVAITSGTPGATVRYTLDGSDPTETHGTEYAGPIHVAATTVLRAAAFKENMAPSNIDTQTYIFVDDVLAQSPGGEAPGPGWPAGSVNGQVFDYGMDPNILADPRYAGIVDDALLAIPSVSLVTDLDNLVDPATGIYVNARQDGREWERPVSMELIDPAGGDQFQIDAGLRIRGAWSRTERNPKHAFRLFFRSEYGDAKLEFPLFGDEGVQTFDTLDLRTSQDYSWTLMADTRNAMVRDVFARDVQRDMGQPYTRSRYYHLYINGQYWGLFQSQERAEASFAETYFGGDKSDYDVAKVDRDADNIVVATDGTIDSYRRLHAAAVSGFADDADYYRIQGQNTDGSPNPGYERLLDVDNLIDYMISIFYTGEQDGPVSNPLGGKPNNFFAIYNRNNPDGYKFFRHDAEMSLDTGIVDQVNPFRADLGYQAQYFNPQWLHTQLTANAEYEMRFADRVHELFFNDGALTPQQSAERLQQRADEIDQAMIAESARWGDHGVEPPRNQLDDWLPTINNIVNNYFPGRTDVVLAQFRGKGWYPGVAAPSFNQHGGWIPGGFDLTIDAPAGTIYYTLDGTDPHAGGGAVSQAALVYSPGMEIPLTEGVLVKTRAFSGDVWSALNQAAFSIGQPASASNLVVTEINYNPAPPTSDELAIDSSWLDSDFEFIELQNVSGETIDLAGARFTGNIQFTFTGLNELAPGQYIVVAANPHALAARYATTGVLIADGRYTGLLADSGARIRLGDVAGEDIFDFTYNDAGSWPGRADGKGATLQLLDPAAVPHGDPLRSEHLGDGENWRSSVRYGGTPGDPAQPPTGIVINEVLSHTDLPDIDSIELYNTTGGTIDIGRWYLSDSWGWALNPENGDYKKFQIAPGTSIGPGEYLVFDEDHFGGVGPLDFALDGAHGDDVWLMKSDGAGNLTHFADHVDFGAAANGESLGRWPNGSGDLYPMTLETLGDANSGPRIGPVIISEIMYNPPDPDGPGGVDPDDLEFIELYNPTDSAIDLAAWTDNPHGGAAYLAYWRLRGGVDMEFDPGTIIDADGGMVVLSFDPNDAANAARVADFRTYYGIDSSVPLTGGYSGSLDDDGERVELQRPDSPPLLEPGFVPHMLEDEVRYDDTAPWPIAPDGGGDSLNRVHYEVFGNSAGSWRPGGPTPGRASVFTLPPFVVTPVDDVSVDEDAAPSIIDVSATFDDIDGDTLILSVGGNTNPDLVTADVTAGILTLSYLPEANGTANIAVRATDQAGAWIEDTFTVTVAFINDTPPTVAQGAPDITVDEDAFDSILNMTGVFDDLDLGDSIALSVTGNTNTGLVEASIVNGHVSLSYLSDQNGAADITVRGTDSGGLWVEDTFTVTVNPAGDAPTVVSPIGEAAFDEDQVGAVVDLSNVFDDIDAGDTLSLSLVDNSNTDLVTADLIGEDLMLAFATDQYGSAEVTVRATDSSASGFWVDDTFTITVNPVNDLPVLAQLPDRSVDEDDSFSNAINLWYYASDTEDADTQMTFSVVGDTNPGCGVSIRSDRLLDIIPAPDWCGYSDVTVQVRDRDGGLDTSTFRITVNPLNDAPLVNNPLADFAVDEDSPETVLGLADVFGDIDPGDSLTFSIAGVTNPGLVTANLVDDELTLSCTPDQNGSSSISVRAMDSEGEPVIDTFTVTVNPVNDAPRLAGPIDDFFVFENDPDTVLDASGVFWDIDAGDILTLSVLDNANPGLVTAEMVGSQLTLSYLPGQIGAAEITVRATDSGDPGLWFDHTFAVTVYPNNFPPTVSNPLSDLAVDPGSADTVVDLSNTFDDTYGIIPTLDYTVVEIDPATGSPADGTGLFAYTFTLYGHDGIDESFITTSLTFTGPIQQTVAFGSIGIDDESTAIQFEGFNGSGYLAALDTWICEGWAEIAFGDTDITGSPVVLSLLTGPTEYSGRKDLVHIVASSDVQWSGSFIRQGVSYDTSGAAGGDRLTLSVEGNTNPGLVEASIWGSQLTLVYAPDAVGRSDITIRATDSAGEWVDDTFSATVGVAAEIVGRHLFYNNSAWDAGDDDASIAPDKNPLLPGGVAASENCTNYIRGINGIMVDIESPIGAPTTADFGVRVNHAANPDTWSAGPTPTVSVRPGDGAGDSDRVTLTWADGEIVNQWVEVTVKAGGNTGLAVDDVFYFGNCIADCDGDGAVGDSDYNTLVGEFGRHGGIGALASDLNGDGRVDLTDFATMRAAYGDAVLAPTFPTAAPIAGANVTTPAAPVVSQPHDNRDANDDSIVIAGFAPAIDLLAINKVEGLAPSPSVAGYNYIPQPIHGGSSDPETYRAATAEYDLKPLSDNPDADDADDSLADLLAESPLASPL